jgi:RNA recognition motif-containing protein
MKLYIGSLNYSTTEDEIDRLFSDYGSVESVSLVKDNQSGQSRGFGFIEIPNNSDADKAIKALNGSSFQGKVIKVNQAQPKSKNSQSRRNKRY